MRQYAFVVTLLAAILLGTAAQCEPISKNLASFKVLVSDYSETSGGMHPAITQAGTLVFRANHSTHSTNGWGDLYLMSGLELIDANTTVTPSKLEFEMDGTGASVCPSENCPRMDWSLDGNRLAISQYDGCVYVLENIKKRQKLTLDSRVVAKPGLYKGDKLTGQYYCPKWSPDGKKIAVLCEREGSQPTLVELIDVESGKSTVLADDALSLGLAWTQPWSPDSKRLVYASVGDPKGTGRISIVPVDGGTVRKFIDDKDCFSPCWSLKSGKIAYISKSNVITEARSATCSNVATAVRVVDSAGGSPVTVVEIKGPSAADIREFDTHGAASLRDAIESGFGSLMTDSQKKLLRNGKLDDCIQDVAFFFLAKAMGGELWKSASGHEKDLGTPRFNLRKDKSFIKAHDALQPGEKAQLDKEVKRVFWVMMAELAELQPDVYTDPYWSPDETRIACVRWSMVGDAKTLVVIDTKTKKETEICTGAEINCVSWVGNKTLVAQVSRMMYSLSDYDNYYNYSGYPEIWMMTLK